MIREKVDLAIEHQLNKQFAPILSAHLLAARIPLIAMGTSHPGTTYFGGNNYEAGLIGGRALGLWTKKASAGRVDQLVPAEMEMAGPPLRWRPTGIEAGVRELQPNVPQVVRLVSVKN